MEFFQYTNTAVTPPRSAQSAEFADPGTNPLLGLDPVCAGKAGRDIETNRKSQMVTYKSACPCDAV
jgi:hypothetical protein